jgi:shikimate kinase
VGRKLAQALGQSFQDSDAVMELQAGRTIDQIFSGRGEAVFRRYERYTLRRLVQRFPRAVIATGGGAFAQDSTRAFLLSHTLTIWLDVPLSMLEERLEGDTSRPLLHGDGRTARLAALEAARLACYRQALVHCSGRSPPAETVSSILEHLSAYAH